MVREHVSLVRSEGNCKQVLGSTRPIRHAVAVNEERDVPADDPRGDRQDFPHERTVDERQLVVVLREQVVISDVVAQIVRLFVVNASFDLAEVAALSVLVARSSWLLLLLVLCLSFVWQRVSMDDLGGVVHRSVLVHQEGPAHLPRGDKEVVAQPED